MPPTYGDFDKKITKNEGKKWKKWKFVILFWKWYWSLLWEIWCFLQWTLAKMGCTMGKMARHVSQIGCTMGKTIKNVFFRTFFESQKNKKRVPRSWNLLSNLLNTPYPYRNITLTPYSNLTIPHSNLAITPYSNLQ